MGRSMAHIAHSPTWPTVCLEGGVSRWLVGVVGLGAELHQRPHAARGVLLPFEYLCIRKTRVSRPWGTLPQGLAGVSELRPLFPGGPGGGKPLLCHNPGLSNVQEESLSCARDQVVIARPPVLTPPWRYRLSALSL
jgi:hypothetical protein